MNGRVGLSGSACGLPHDSLEIFISRHRHASRLRDKDPQRLHPKAGCLIPATDKDILPFALINAIRLGRIEEGQARGLAVRSIGRLRRSCQRSVSCLEADTPNWYQNISARVCWSVCRKVDWRKQANARFQHGSPLESRIGDFAEIQKRYWRHERLSVLNVRIT